MDGWMDGRMSLCERGGHIYIYIYMTTKLLVLYTVQWFDIRPLKHLSQTRVVSNWTFGIAGVLYPG